jgi:hypothetical protein
MELEDANACREDGLDREPPTIVRAYRQVCGGDPSPLAASMTRQ